MQFRELFIASVLNQMVRAAEMPLVDTRKKKDVANLQERFRAVCRDVGPAKRREVVPSVERPTTIN